MYRVPRASMPPAHTLSPTPSHAHAPPPPPPPPQTRDSAVKHHTGGYSSVETQAAAQAGGDSPGFATPSHRQPRGAAAQPSAALSRAVSRAPSMAATAAMSTAGRSGTGTTMRSGAIMVTSEPAYPQPAVVTARVATTQYSTRRGPAVRSRWGGGGM